jgi:hypothetical protein
MGGAGTGGAMERAGAAVGFRRSGVGQVLVHFGMLLAALAFASWWTSHTILDTARTRRITDAVLENDDVRTFVANRISSVTAPAVGAPVLGLATATRAAGPTAAAPQAALSSRLAVVLDRPDIRVKLEAFVAAAHDRLVGASTTPAVLDKQTVDTLVAAAVPNMSAAEVAKVPAVTFDVPQVGALRASRGALQHRFRLYALGALVLVPVGIATSRDKRAALKIVGAWLIGISLTHLIMLWIIPVMIVPTVSSSPWAHLVASVARALSGGVVVGLVVLVASGLVLVFIDRFVPSGAPAVAEPQ